MSPRIVLARREKDLMDGQPDYAISAGEQRIGRVYRKDRIGDRELWFCGMTSVVFDMTVGVPTHGDGVESFEAARDRLRAAFDHWLAWRWRSRAAT
jgi:hypothetical protein